MVNAALDSIHRLLLYARYDTHLPEMCSNSLDPSLRTCRNNRHLIPVIPRTNLQEGVLDALDPGCLLAQLQPDVHAPRHEQVSDLKAKAEGLESADLTQAGHQLPSRSKQGVFSS